MFASSSSATPERRVLIIEDDDDAREAMRALLELSGHTVEGASDGTEGLARALAVRPDVVLIDIGLPGIDGREVAHRLRGAPEGKTMYLVALTGYGARGGEAAEADFDAHLVKPVDIEDLGRVLARLPHPEGR